MDWLLRKITELTEEVNVPQQKVITVFEKLKEVFDNGPEMLSSNVDAKIAYTGNYNTDLLIVNDAAYIKYAKQDNDTITFYCLGGNPKIDIPVELEVYIWVNLLHYMDLVEAVVST